MGTMATLGPLVPSSLVIFQTKNLYFVILITKLYYFHFILKLLNKKISLF